MGDFWFAIGAGSVTGLAGSSTHWLYYDRTSPGSFAVTTDAGAAEGLDRVIVAAVVTTSSPDPCTVHPPGFVTG